MKFMKSKLAVLACGSVLSLTALADAPSQITVTNNTNLTLSTSIAAGLPGNDFAAHQSRDVNYGLISMGCNAGGMLDSCPLKFTDKSNGETVATVNINVNTATLVGPPVFFGEYGDKYEVQGWEASPLQNIVLSEKA